MFTKEEVKKEIEQNEEKELEVSLELGAGKLKLTGGTDKIMEGTFSYKGKAGDPVIDYEETEDFKGELTIIQRDGITWNPCSVKQDWNLALNDILPLFLHLELGAGKSELNLSEINLKDLKIEAGVGETRIDLTGEWEESFKVQIESGVGKTRLLLPKHVGVKLDVDKGIGRVQADYFMNVGDTFRNQVYENAHVKIDIDINIGIGDVIIE
jgi:hypothetical protein